MKKIKASTFYCFSPPVMIATFVVEIALLIYTLVVRPKTKTVYIGSLLLLFLAVFQLAEYGVCESFGINGLTASKLGFSVITMLPPLGLHLVFLIARKKSILVPAAYIAGLVWIALFWSDSLLSGSVCAGNYIIFQIANPQEGQYYLYYDGVMLLSLYYALHFAKKLHGSSQKALYWLVTGYLAFIIPSIVFSFIDNYVGTDSPLPSVMCGFAVILAVILSLKVLPEATKKGK